MHFIEKIKRKMTEASNAAESIRKNNASEETPVTSFALLRTPAWEPDVFLRAFEEDWGVKIVEKVPLGNSPWIFRVFGSVVVLGMQPTAVPKNGADHAAERTFDWPDAVRLAHEHTAYLLAAVVPETADAVENARTAAKVMASAAAQPNATAVEGGGRLFSPDAYRAVALKMKDRPETFPAPLIIGTGIWQEKEGGGFYACTVGLSARFGLPEIEIVDSKKAPEVLRDVVETAIRLELEAGKILKDGDVLARAGKNWQASLAKSYCLEGTTTLQLADASAQ